MQKHRKSVVERKNREKKQRIQSILGEAKKLFLSKGYRETTMDQVALEAGFSKATIYQYFKSKDDLYFSLLLPIAEDSNREMKKVEEKLYSGKYSSGADFIRDMFKHFYKAYEKDPEGFKILQLFQQTGMLWELSEETRLTIFETGKTNFKLARRLIRKAIQQNLIKEVNVYHFADIMWGGLFVGLIQTADIKSGGKGISKHLKPTLKMAQELMIEAVAK
jgi:TetR/AcrR family transcriptional regulator